MSMLRYIEGSIQKLGRDWDDYMRSELALAVQGGGPSGYNPSATTHEYFEPIIAILKKWDALGLPVSSIQTQHGM